MPRYFFRYLSSTLLALQDRIEQQKEGNKPIFKFQFPSDAAYAVIYDSLRQAPNGVKLHEGIGVDMYVEAQGKQDCLNKAEALCEHILGLLTFSQLCPCGTPELRFTYDATRDIQERDFRRRHTLSSPDLTLGSLRTINITLLGAVWDGSMDITVSVKRAIQWLRKGLLEQHSLDEFVAYWIALETISPFLNQKMASAIVKEHPRCPKCQTSLIQCPQCGAEIGRDSKWSGLFAVIEKTSSLSKKDFETARKFRGGLVHGGSELLDERVTRFRQEQLPKVRELLIRALSTVLNLSSPITDAIVALGLRRITLNPWVYLEGQLKLASAEPSPGGSRKATRNQNSRCFRGLCCWHRRAVAGYAQTELHYLQCNFFSSFAFAGLERRISHQSILSFGSQFEET